MRLLIRYAKISRKTNCDEGGAQGKSSLRSNLKDTSSYISMNSLGLYLSQETCWIFSPVCISHHGWGEHSNLRCSDYSKIHFRSSHQRCSISNFIKKETLALVSLHKKWSFPLRIPSVNVTKSAGNCGHIYWRNP